MPFTLAVVAVVVVVVGVVVGWDRMGGGGVGVGVGGWSTVSKLDIESLTLELIDFLEENGVRGRGYSSPYHNIVFVSLKFLNVF